MTTDDIKILVERFFDGDTTLDEERTLYDYFASDEVDSTLLPYKEMFRDFGSIPLNVRQSDDSKEEQPTSTQTIALTIPEKNDKQESFPILKKHIHHWHWVAAAAIIVAVCFIGSTAYRSFKEKQLFDRYEGSYMIVHGERIDDLNSIHRHIEHTLAQAETAERDFDAYSVIQNAEAELLNDIADAAEREEILRMLNE